MIKVTSFGYKTGTTPVGATAIVDCRDLLNPHKHHNLRSLTGLDQDVRDYVSKDTNFVKVLSKAYGAVKLHSNIGFGCLGGRHRSVAVAEAFASAMRATGKEVEVVHRELAA